MDKLSCIFFKIASAFALLMALFILYLNMEHISKWLVILSFLACAGISFLLYRMNAKPKLILGGILLISLLWRLYFIIAVPTPPVSDFYDLFSTAQKVAAGDFSGFYTYYFQYWAYQTPFVLYEALVLKLGGTEFILKLLNVFYMVGSNLLLYCIIKQLISERCARVGAFLYAVFPAPVLLASLLTNQHLALFLLLFGLYILLKQSKRPILSAVFSGLLFGLSNLMRPQVAIILLALAAVLILSIIKTHTKKQVLGFLFRGAALLLAYGIITVSISSFIKISGINPNGAANTRPEWKVIVGLDMTMDGTVKDTNKGYLLRIEDDALRSEAVRQAIRQDIDKYRLPSFFLQKSAQMWGDTAPTFWAFWGLDLNKKIFATTYEKFAPVIAELDKGIYLFIWVLFAVSACLFLFRKSTKEREKMLLFAIITIGFFLVYQIIEIQTRYRYDIMPFVFLFAAAGFQIFGFRKKKSAE